MTSLRRKGLWLEYFTVAYNVFEAIAAISFGNIAQSSALVGFGLDSLIESLSAGVLIWRLSSRNKSRDKEEELEKRAVQFVAITFFILGIYVLFDSGRDLLTNEIPEQSLPGLVIAVLSVLIMPTLAFAKYRIGKEINSKALIADSKETFICCLLSVSLLVGLGFNYLLGFWQADPVAGLVIGLFLLREGLENWQEASEECEED